MRTVLSLTFALLLQGCSSPQEVGVLVEPGSSHGQGTSSPGGSVSSGPDSSGDVLVVPVSEVSWGLLNPARGSQSPAAGTLFGDRGSNVATGFLLRPADGFESPPHNHNVSYRGIVIRGEFHNDDPEASKLWMPTLSYWTQPRGENHITAARGESTLAYIEIDSGPYLVQPADDAFETDERPVNVHATNLVWSNVANGPAGAQQALLWSRTGDDAESGRLVKLPAGYNGYVSVEGGQFRGVTIRGTMTHGTRSPIALAAGSYFSSYGPESHPVSCVSDDGCVLYLRSDREPALR